MKIFWGLVWVLYVFGYFKVSMLGLTDSTQVERFVLFRSWLQFSFFFDSWYWEQVLCLRAFWWGLDIGHGRFDGLGYLWFLKLGRLNVGLWFLDLLRFFDRLSLAYAFRLDSLWLCELVWRFLLFFASGFCRFARFFQFKVWGFLCSEGYGFLECFGLFMLFGRIWFWMLQVWYIFCVPFSTVLLQYALSSCLNL